MVTASTAAQLPERVPSSDINKNMLMTLDIMREASQYGYFCRIPAVTITGHVDSGKSTCTASCLREMGVLPEALFEAAEKEAMEKAVETGVDDRMGSIATIVEKGKEAKTRGMTIDTRVWRVGLKNIMTFPKDSAEHKKAIENLEALKIEYTTEGDQIVYALP